MTWPSSRSSATRSSAWPRDACWSKATSRPCAATRRSLRPISAKAWHERRAPLERRRRARRLRRRRYSARHRPQRRPARDRRHRRAERRRQVDCAEGHLRAAHSARRGDPLRRPGHHRLGAEPHRALRHRLRAPGRQRVPRNDRRGEPGDGRLPAPRRDRRGAGADLPAVPRPGREAAQAGRQPRSEEPTSELQSLMFYTYFPPLPRPHLLPFLLTLRGGEIRFDDRDITGWAPNRIVRCGIGYVPQVDNVFREMTVEENLEMGAFLRRGAIDEALERIYRLFPDLVEKRRKPAGSLDRKSQRLNSSH